MNRTLGGQLLSMNLSVGRTARGLLAGAIGVVAAIALLSLDEWLGDWVGPLWLLSPFALAFIIGMAVGSRATGKRGALLGALVGAAVVLVPSGGVLLYHALSGQDLGAEVSTRGLLRLWLAFSPVAMLQGALSGPVGATARSYLQRKSRS